MALGGPSRTTLIDDAVTQLVEMGVFLVTAAGNSFDDSCNYAPSRVEGAVNVGATKRNDMLRSSSNGGSCVNIVAPGHKISAASHLGDDHYISYSGTSMAAPHVAGAAALILSESKRLAAQDALRLLTHKAKMVPDESFKMKYPLLRLSSGNCDLYDAEPLLKNKGTVGISASPSPSAIPSPSKFAPQPTEEPPASTFRQASRPLFSPLFDERATAALKPTIEQSTRVATEEESSPRMIPLPPSLSSTPSPSSSKILLVPIRNSSKSVDGRISNSMSDAIQKGIGRGFRITPLSPRVTSIAEKK